METVLEPPSTETEVRVDPPHGSRQRGWKKFVSARLERRMNQTEAAAFFRCSQTVISAWETLSRPPALEDIPLISAFLNLSETEAYTEIRQTFFSHIPDYRVLYP